MYSNICAINSGCIASGGSVLVVAAGLTFYADRWGRDLRNAAAFHGTPGFLEIFRKKNFHRRTGRLVALRA